MSAGDFSSSCVHDVAISFGGKLAIAPAGFNESTRAAIAALGDMVRMTGDDDTGEAGHAQ